MPRIPPRRSAAFDILDWLFFNQTWFVRLTHDDEASYETSMRGEGLVALFKIKEHIDLEVAATGATGIGAQALRHTVLCLLEVGFGEDLVQKARSGHADLLDITDERGVPMSKLSEDIDPATAALVHQFEQRLFAAHVTALGEQVHGVCADKALAIAAHANAAFKHAPTTAKYRLTERIFFLEFLDAPVKFLSWMYRIGVLESKKFVAGRVTRDISDDFKARVGMLCEFLLLREHMARVVSGAEGRTEGVRLLQKRLGDKISDAAWMQLQDESDFYARLDRHKARLLGSHTFDLARIDDDAYLHGFLEHFARAHRRSRFWTGPQQSWTGVVGAGLMLCYHLMKDPNRKITRNGNNHSKSDKPAAAEETVAQHICDVLNEHGLDCRPGSLYETFVGCYMKQPAGLYHRATVYLELQQKFDVVFPAHFFDPAYAGVITTSTPQAPAEP